MDSAQLEALINSPARIMPAHQLRFLPEVVSVNSSHDSGKLGVPGLLRTHLWVTDDLPAEQLSPDLVDLALCFFGTGAQIVHCLRRPNYLQLHLGFSGDAMALIDIATRRPGADMYFSMHLIGSDGAIYADDHRNAQLLFAGDGTRALIHQPNFALATQKMLQEFVAGDWQVGLADTLEVQRCLQEEGGTHG